MIYRTVQCDFVCVVIPGFTACVITVCVCDCEFEFLIILVFYDYYYFMGFVRVCVMFSRNYLVGDEKM